MRRSSWSTGGQQCVVCCDQLAVNNECVVCCDHCCTRSQPHRHLVWPGHRRGHSFTDRSVYETVARYSHDVTGLRSCTKSLTVEAPAADRWTTCLALPADSGVVGYCRRHQPHCVRTFIVSRGIDSCDQEVSSRNDIPHFLIAVKAN